MHKAVKPIPVPLQLRDIFANSQKRESGMAVASQDSIGIEGRLKIEAIYPDKNVVLIDEKNLVVRQAESIMPYMSVGLKSFSYIELGDPSPATAPALSNIALEQTTGQYKAVTPTINGNVVTLEAQWLTTEGNGYSYTEAGLFCTPLGGGELFARKAFDAINKSNAFALKFTWAISFKVGEGSNAGCQGVSLLGSSTITHDYYYVASGGESELPIPIDFIVGGKTLDVFLNSARLYYTQHYYESTIGATQGIKFVGFTALPGDEFYIVKRTLA